MNRQSNTTIGAKSATADINHARDQFLELEEPLNEAKWFFEIADYLAELCIPAFGEQSVTMSGREGNMIAFATLQAKLAVERARVKFYATVEQTR